MSRVRSSLEWYAFTYADLRSCPPVARKAGKQTNAELLVRRELAGAPQHTREGWPSGTPTAEHLRQARFKLRKTDPIFGTDNLNSRRKAAAD